MCKSRDYYRSFQISKNISNLSQLLIISKKNVHLPLVSKQTAHEEHNSKYLILGRPFLFLSYIEIRICICEFHDWLSSCVCQVRELITANCFQQKFNGPWKTPRFAFKGKTLPCLLESDRQHGHHDLNHKMHVEMNSSFCFDACLAIDAVLKWKMIDAIPLLDEEQHISTQETETESSTLVVTFGMLMILIGSWCPNVVTIQIDQHLCTHVTDTDVAIFLLKFFNIVQKFERNE